MALSWLRRRRGARPAVRPSVASPLAQPPGATDSNGKGHRAPSSETTGRLVRAVGGELDRLRSDVSEELVLVRLLLDVGHVEAANRLIGEQSARLRNFQGHVEAAIASAVVERTAEEILAEAAEAPDRSHAATPPPAEDDGQQAAALQAGGARSRLRLLVTAASLFVLAALLVSGGPLPGLYQLVSEKLQGPSHSQEERARGAGQDGNARGGKDDVSGSEEPLMVSEDAGPGDAAEAPEILLLLGRLARFAEGSGGAPVAALLDVDRLVARLVSEVAPLLAPLPSEESGGEAAPAPRQKPQPDAAPQPETNPQSQPPTGEQSASQTQPGGPPPPDASLVTQPPPIEEGAEGDSMRERWHKQREQSETEAPGVPDQLAPRN